MFSLVCLRKNATWSLLGTLYTKQMTSFSNISQVKKTVLNRNKNGTAKRLIHHKMFFSNGSKFGTFWNIDHLISKERVNEFLAVSSEIIKDLTETDEQDIPEVNAHFSDILHYILPNGKKLAPYITIAAHEMLEENLTPEKLRLANIMGWVVEVFQSATLVADDIMDQAKIRRGVPCWHTRQDIGLTAINDCYLLVQGVNTLLKKHFSNHHCYLPSIELFQDTARKLAKGQVLDVRNKKNGKPNLEIFTMDRFKRIAEYKFSYQIFQLPIGLAMYMANLYDPQIQKEVNGILNNISHYYQAQDDYLDCFGNQELTGKNSNDIREGKCTWLAVMALDKVNSDQRRIMDINYGSPKPEAVNTIFSLFEELKLLEIYSSYVENYLYNDIRKNIENFASNEQLQTLLIKIMESVHERRC